MRTIIIFLTISVYSSFLYAQFKPIEAHKDSLFYSSKIAELHGLGNESYPNQTKPLPYQIAHTYFPELNNVSIIFKSVRIKTTLNTRPTIFSTLFRSKAQRKYIIRINNTPKPGKIILDEVPFLPSIGLYGHELAHIKDYQSANLFGILKRGLLYMFTKTKSEFEQEIDRITIAQGLGHPLYSWAHFVLYDSNASEEYIEYKKKVYYSDLDIINIINKEIN